MEGAHSLVIAVNRRHLSLSSAACALLWCASSAAQEGTRVDLHSGPVISSGRVIGLGGAFLAVAEGADSQLINPAAYTMRPPHTVDDWFDWDFALSWFDIGARDGIDLDQSGRAAFEDAQLLQVGFNLKFGRHGFGLIVAQESYTISRTIDGVDQQLVYGQVVPSFGYAYAWDTFTLGVSLVGSNAEISRARDQDPFAELTGAGFLLGGVYHVPESPWRFGATLRTQSVGKNFRGDTEAVNTLVPGAIVLPWSVSIGAARMWGARTFNPLNSYGDGQPATLGRGRYLMATADLVLTGPTADAVTAQAFLDADSQSQDIPASLSVHAGAEAEVIADRLRVRTGTYYEPDRLAPLEGRWHITGGADLGFEWGWKWRLGAVFDAADAYLNLGVGLGLWR